MLHIDKIYLIHLHTKIIHTKRSCDDFNLYICFLKLISINYGIILIEEYRLDNFTLIRF